MMSTWREISDHIKNRIDSGEFNFGQKLPREAELGEEYSVSRSTIHRALELLESLGYVESRKRGGTYVRKEPREKRHLVALIFDRVAKNFDFPSSEMIDGIKDALGDQFGLVLCDSKDSIEREANFLSRMSRETDGIICFPIADQRDGTFLEKLHATGFPVVVVDRIPVGFKGSAVISDDRGATLSAIRMLRDHGHEHIGFLGFHKETVTSAMARYNAFLEGMRECFGIDGEPFVRWIGREFEMNGDLLQTSINDIVFSMTKGPQQVTALYCIQDDIALKVLRAAEQFNIRIPDDLEIVSINEWPPLALRRPWDIHRIVRKKFRIGVVAAELLQEQMSGARTPSQTCRIEADFIPSTPQNSPLLDEVQAWLEDEKKQKEILQ
ncbi:MAG: LacI family DNA-binding transcriptional regulator [Armatimonadetes bacterium]|nr:LacI family DNA-binding transcriptional regulator [Armatimonadota bacterium]